MPQPFITSESSPRAALARRDCLGLLVATAVLNGPALGREQQRPGRIPLALSQSVNIALLEPLLSQLAQAAQWRWELMPVPFSRMLLMVERGDALGLGVGPTPQRRQRLVFSQPLQSSGLWAISRRENSLDPHHPSELQGLRVCMVRDASYGDDLDRARGAIFQPVYSNGDFAGRLRMLLAGRCELLLATHASPDIALLVQRIRDAGIDPQQLAIGRQPLVELPIHIAASRDGPWASYLPRVDQALQTMQAAMAALPADVGVAEGNDQP